MHETCTITRERVCRHSGISDVTILLMELLATKTAKPKNCNLDALGVNPLLGSSDGTTGKPHAAQCDARLEHLKACGIASSGTSAENLGAVLPGVDGILEQLLVGIMHTDVRGR